MNRRIQKGHTATSTVYFEPLELALKHVFFDSVCINIVCTNAHLDKMPGKTSTIPSVAHGNI